MRTFLPYPAVRTLVAVLCLPLMGCAVGRPEAAPPPTEVPAAVAPPVSPVAAVAAAPPAAKAAMPAATARRTEPPLDIAALKLRLRETKAIGVMAKLSLRKQMDDLLKRFRVLYQSGQTGVSALRPPYDELIGKVLAQLQKGDPALARSISGSREAIWKLLADPEKFVTLG